MKLFRFLKKCTYTSFFINLRNTPSPTTSITPNQAEKHQIHENRGRGVLFVRSSHKCGASSLSVFWKKITTVGKEESREAIVEKLRNYDQCSYLCGPVCVCMAAAAPLLLLILFSFLSTARQTDEKRECAGARGDASGEKAFGNLSRSRLGGLRFEELSSRIERQAEPQNECVVCGLFRTTSRQTHTQVEKSRIRIAPCNREETLFSLPDGQPHKIACDNCEKRQMKYYGGVRINKSRENSS